MSTPSKDKPKPSFSEFQLSRFQCDLKNYANFFTQGDLPLGKFLGEVEAIAIIYCENFGRQEEIFALTMQDDDTDEDDEIIDEDHMD